MLKTNVKVSLLLIMGNHQKSSFVLWNINKEIKIAKKLINVICHRPIISNLFRYSRAEVSRNGFSHAEMSKNAHLQKCQEILICRSVQKWSTDMHVYGKYTSEIKSPITVGAPRCRRGDLFGL